MSFSVAFSLHSGQQANTPLNLLEIHAHSQFPSAEVRNFNQSAKAILATLPVHCLACLVEQGQPLSDAVIVQPCDRHRASREQVGR